METTVKVNEIDTHYQIDIIDCPYPNIVDAILELRDKWLLETAEAPDLLYLGWKTIIALVFHIQVFDPEITLMGLLNFHGMEIRVLEQSWHLEVGFLNPTKQVMACVKK